METHSYVGDLPLFGEFLNPSVENKILKTLLSIRNVEFYHVIILS